MNRSFLAETFGARLIGNPEVCVIGGGPAGLSAAIGAARCGKSVLLVEKNGFCGGEAVAGLSGTICGLFSSGQHPEQIVFGFADEFYSLLKARDGVTAPMKFGRTMLLPHDGLTWKEVADHLLQAHHIHVRYHTSFVRAEKDESGKITEILLFGADGFSVVMPGAVVDASGDAVVAHSVHESTRLGDHGVVQTPTMMFKMGNVDIETFLDTDPSMIIEAVSAAAREGTFRLPRHHVYLFPLPNRGEVLCNMTRITYPDGSIPLGISPADMTFAEMEGRRQAREYARFLKERIPAFCHAYLADTGSKVGVRQTRSVKGKGILTNRDVLEGKKHNWAVTHSAWPMEVHGSGRLEIVYLEDDYFDIPFETLVPEKSLNLLVAGRCMSAEHEALASARVTGQCFGMGYAAGAACALMSDEGFTAGELSGEEVGLYMKTKKLKDSMTR